MKRSILFLFVVVVAAVAGFGQVGDKVTVAAAANVAAVGEPLRAAFAAQYPGSSVEFVFGASGALATQIQNGAPFQVFLSADVVFPQKLYDAGFAAAAPRVYATGKLILLSVKPLDFSRGLAVLTDPGLTQFALANPEIAPYGKAAFEALTKAGLWESVKAKAVTAQTITQALQFTLGATGVGFVNKSALYTKDLAAYVDREGTNWVEVDPATHAPIAQAFVVLKTAAANPTAQKFATFLGSPAAKAIFVQAGYAVP